jgi:putative ABC transport system permease protein
MDFVNIGILKAVGMTNASVKLALLAGYMCTVAAGLFAGIPLAIPILKIINSATRSSSGLEVPSDINVGLVLCVILAILLLVAAFIMLKTRRISEATPIKAIRGGRGSVHFSSVLKLPVSGKKLGVSLAYRQFISEKKQYAAAIIVTAILAMFMILMNDMMRWFNSQNMLVDMFSVTKYDLTASFVDEDTQKDIENVISEHTAYRKYQMFSEYLLFDDVQMYCYIVEDPDMINTIRKGRTCTYDNEVLITQYVADGFHMNVGDTVTVKRGGVARKMVISGIYDSANDMGKNFAISKAAYSKFAHEETVSESGVSGAAKSSSDEEEWSGKGICYDLDNTDECDAIIQEIDKRYGDNQGITYSIHSAKDDFEGVAGTVNIAIQGLTLLTYMLGAVFVIVTVIIVCGKVLMREQKDIGIYKALGFTSFRLRCQLAVRFIVTAVVGSLLGIVLALIVSKPFFKAGFESFGIYSFNLSTSVISLVIPLVFMSVLFSVVAFIRAGNIRKVQPQVLIADQ